MAKREVSHHQRPGKDVLWHQDNIIVAIKTWKSWFLLVPLRENPLERARGWYCLRISLNWSTLLFSFSDVEGQRSGLWALLKGRPWKETSLRQVIRVDRLWFSLTEDVYFFYVFLFCFSIPSRIPRDFAYFPWSYFCSVLYMKNYLSFEIARTILGKHIYIAQLTVFMSSLKTYSYK